MYGTIQESFFGQLVYYGSGQRLFKYREERHEKDGGIDVPQKYLAGSPLDLKHNNNGGKNEEKDAILRAEALRAKTQLDARRESYEKRLAAEKAKPVRLQKRVPPPKVDHEALDRGDDFQEQERQQERDEQGESASAGASGDADSERTRVVPSPIVAGNKDKLVNGNKNGLVDRKEIIRARENPERVLGLSENEKGEDPNLVDWYGPDDPENPMNFSPFKKWFIVFCISLITISVYMGSSIITPGIEGLMADMHVSQEAAALSLTLFVAGYATGPLILSPITEIPAIGRTPPYIITLAIFCALQVPAALMPRGQFAGFLVVRFLQGFIGSPPLATGGASLNDMFGPKARPYALGLWGLAAAGGPAIGPVVSGYAVQAESWRWAFWIMLWLSGGSLIFLFFFLPETSALNILVRRARRLRKLTGNDRLRSQGEIDQAQMTGKDIAMMTFVRPFQLMFLEPIVFALNLYISFIYALLYAWFEAFPIVYQQGYGFPLGNSNLPYIAILVGAFVGYLMYIAWHSRVWCRKYDEADGELAPEERLVPAIPASLCYPICLFWFGWSANRTNYWSPVIASSFFGIGTSILFQTIFNDLTDSYGQYAASVLASNDFMRSMFGAGMPLAAGPMFRNLGIGRGSSILGGVSCAFIPLPILLYKYGPWLRSKSKFATS